MVKAANRQRVHILTVLIYGSLAGFVPNMMRSGIESFRYYTVEFFAVPFIFLVLLPFLLGRRQREIEFSGTIKTK